MLEAIDVGYRHPDGQEALCAVDFRLDQGEKVVLFGANGTGKSTLLKLLNGLLPPTTGSVSYDGRVVDRAALREAAFHQRFRREVVLLFQDPDAMLFNPTVFDEIAFGPRQLNLDGVDERVHHWASELGVAALLGRTPFALSGGEKQRVCLAALLVLEPKVLLLDEPTANMDPRSAGWLVDFLEDLNQTTLVTTHNLSLGREFGNRCLVLGEDHRLVYDGPVRDFLSDHHRLAAANLVHRHRRGKAKHGHLPTNDWD